MEVKEISLSDIASAYQYIAGMPEGQIVIQDLVRRFGFTRTTTIDADPMRMAYKEGGRAVCVHIGRMIDSDAKQLAEQTAARGEE
jgi:hypothetical protein